MRVLLDTCVAGSAKNASDPGADVVWGGDWQRDPVDEEIIEPAFREQRVLVTLDKDFGELAVVRGLNHCGIVRLVGLRASLHGPYAARAIRRYERELAAGAIVTVAVDRVRVRPGRGEAHQ